MKTDYQLRFIEPIQEGEEAKKHKLFSFNPFATLV